MSIQAGLVLEKNPKYEIIPAADAVRAEKNTNAEQMLFYRSSPFSASAAFSMLTFSASSFACSSGERG